MDKHAVAIVLDEISTLLEIHGENKFKARAFAGAARAVEKVEGELAALVRSGELETIPGVGPATAGVIRELVNTGTSRYYLELRERTPDGLLELLAVPKLGATRIRTLFEELGVDSLAALEQAARDHRIAPVKGFGEKTEARILEGRRPLAEHDVGEGVHALGAVERDDGDAVGLVVEDLLVVHGLGIQQTANSKQQRGTAPVRSAVACVERRGVISQNQRAARGRREGGGNGVQGSHR